MTTFRTLEDVIANWPLANNIANDPTRADDDRITRADDGTFCTVGELRTAMTSVSAEQLRAFERELRRRDAGFMRIVSTNANFGTGTYEARITGTDDSHTATKPFTFDGDTILTPKLAPPSTAGVRAAEEFPGGDIYAAGLATMRAASATAESFEDRWKSDRARQLAAESERIDSHIFAHPSAPRLTTAEVHENYAPPDGWALALEKERKNR